MFSIGKNGILSPLKIFGHTAEFLTLGKDLLILLPLYLQMLIMQISTQTDSHKYKKMFSGKKVYSLKNGSEVWKSETLNSTFYAK